MKKRVVSIMLIAAMAASLAVGCGKSSDSGNGGASSGGASSAGASSGEEGKVINSNFPH